MHLQVCFQSIFISHEYLSYWIDQQQQMEVFFLHVAIYSNEYGLVINLGEESGWGIPRIHLLEKRRGVGYKTSQGISFFLVPLTFIQ